MKNSVTREQIEAILEASLFYDRSMGVKSTVVVCILPNGFEIVESSSCVDATNYDHSVGIRICKERIANKVWQLEGYRLQCELAAAEKAAREAAARRRAEIDLHNKHIDIATRSSLDS
jgi:hypothetical protein